MAASVEALRKPGSRVSVDPPLLVACIGGAALLVGAALFILDRFSYDVSGAVFIVPILILGTLPMLAREARREQDRRLFWLLVGALVVKLAGAILRYFVTFTLLGPADAVGYHRQGAEIASHFRHGDFHTGLRGLTGTNFVSLLTGLVYTVTGPTKAGGFIVFSWLSYIGLFFFYKAFRIAVPEGRSKTYAKLIFFLPSMIFWPSSIGKEAWMMFSLGIAAYGAARALSGKPWRGLIVTVIGLILTSWLRPHMAGILGVALALAYTLRRGVRGRRFNPVARSVTIVAMLLLAVVFAVRANQFLMKNGIDTEAGLGTALTENVDRTAIGANSDFSPPSIVSSPVNAPLAVITVLFRPLPFDANNLQSDVSAMEGTALLGLVLWRRKWIIAAVRSSRRQPYVMLAIVFTAMFIVGYSSFANFGLLTRERAQLWPMFMVLLAVTPQINDRHAATP